jgi:hypothetical protein
MTELRRRQRYAKESCGMTNLREANGAITQVLTRQQEKMRQ